MVQEKQSNCPSCKQSLMQNYCPNCGEQKLIPKLRSIKYIIGDIIEDFISVDSKLWKSLGLLFCKPGQLEYNYHIGKRKAYIKPVTLFFIINVIFVMFSPLTDFYISLNDQLTLQPYSSIIKESLDSFLLKQNIPYANFEIKYNEIVKVLSRTLIILQVPVFMLFTSFIFIRRKKYLSDHFIFALNSHSWLLSWVLLFSLMFGLIKGMINLIGLNGAFNQYYFIFLQIGFVVYLFLASKRMYQLSWLAAIGSTILLVCVFMISHVVFRLIQFIITVLVV